MISAVKTGTAKVNRINGAAFLVFVVEAFEYRTSKLRNGLSRLRRKYKVGHYVADYGDQCDAANNNEVTKKSGRPVDYLPLRPPFF